MRIKVKYLSVFILCISVAYIYAADETIINYAKGPVKQIIVTKKIEKNSNRYHDVKVRKQVYWYDSIGRLVEETVFANDMLKYGHVRQYTINNICIEYEYNQVGIVKGNFCQIRMDSTGNQISTKQYIGGKLFLSDSTVYNESGQKIKYYETPSKQNTLALRYTYEYDTYGRLINVRDFLYSQGTIVCHVEYLPNGNFTEFHSDVEGEKWENKYFVNEEKLIIEVHQGHSQRIIYSNFDKYGNWLKSEKKSYDTGTTIVERIVEYYE